MGTSLETLAVDSLLYILKIFIKIFLQLEKYNGAKFLNQGNNHK